MIKDVQMKQLTLRNFFFTKLCHFVLQKGSTAVTVNVLIAAEAITSIMVAFLLIKYVVLAYGVSTVHTCVT